MIKGLIFEGNGYCLCSYRLINGKFQWPRSPDEARDITPQQYRLLMSGFTIEGTIPNNYNSWICGKRKDQEH
jgi:transposase